MVARRSTEALTFDAYTLLQHLPDRVTVTDQDGVILYVNRSFEEVTGYSADEVIGQKPSILKSGEHPDRFYQKLWQTIKSGRPFRAEVINKKKNGELYYEDQLIVPVGSDDGKLRCFISIARDISERREAEARIRHLAEHDELTGLLNRRGLLSRARSALAMTRQLEEHATVLFIDLDNFKLVNDGYGHRIGDLALVAAAQKLKASLRAGDLCGRWGGDEFVVLLPRTGLEEARSVARRLQQHLECPVRVDDALPLIYLQASIGMAVFPQDGHDIDELIKVADKSMYLAKDQATAIAHTEERAGGESPCHQQHRLHLALELPAAIQEEQFELYFQPIVDIETGKVTKAEALLRWRHPSRGLVGPGEFIAVAERSREIVAIDRWAMKSALKEILALQSRGVALDIAVNVSTRTLEECSFLDFLAELEEAYPGAFESLIVEVTEGTFARMERIHHVLKALRARGVRLALDDFGTGYSCLAYLEDLPLDVVKIARRFVQKVGKSGASETIIRATIDLCRELGFGSLAEGVETREQCAWLARAGCAEVQGYWISRPVSREHLSHFVSFNRELGSKLCAVGRRGLG